MRVTALLVVVMALPPFCKAQTAKPPDARYYPLALGNVWTYRVHRTSAKTKDTTVEWRVTHADQTYQVWPKPMQSDDEAMDLAVTQDGMKEVSSNTFIIKFPIKTGERWSAGRAEVGHQPRVFRVLSVKAPCSVGSMKISDCVTIEDASANGLKIVTTYGRDVGPVLYRYYQSTAGNEVLIQTVILVSHNLKGE